MTRRKVIYVGCDGGYFDLFAEIFIASVNINTPNQEVFFSICNPNADFDDRLAHLKSLAFATVIHHEVYFKDLSARSHEEKIGFYVNHRFVQLNQFFQQREVDVLFVDIDSMIRNDLSCLAGLFANADVAIQLRLGERRERVRVLGAGIYIQYNQRTTQFMKQLAIELSEKYTWFTDQLKIYQLLKSNSDIRVSDFSSKYLDWTFSDGALIWTGKGERKHLDDKYLAYADLLLKQFRVKAPLAPQPSTLHRIKAEGLVNLRRPYRLYKSLRKILAFMRF